MNISISKKEIFNEVEKRTSLEGYLSPDNYDSVLANQDRGALLDSYWVEACSSVVQLLKRYITSSVVEHSLTSYNADEVFMIKAEMPARYNSLLDGSVATDIKMFIACNILSGWFKVVAPESAVKYVDEANGYTEDLKSKLLFRDAPTAELNNASDDKQSIGATEAALSSKSVDSETIGATEAALNKGKEDSEVLTQNWCRCSVRHL